jgi:drug/metabolite transporter (DMT)-like permease
MTGSEQLQMSQAVPEFWIVISMLAAAAWGLSCVLDVCLVGRGTYRSAWEGAAVAGLFCLVPALLVSGAATPRDVGLAVAVVSGLSGLVFLLHIYFYFRALFVLNDAVDAEIFNTLSVVFVPGLAFLFLGERLSLVNLSAVAIASVGVAVLVAHQAARANPLALVYLLVSVVLVSVMMVMQAWVLERTAYSTAVWLFSMAAFLAAFLVVAVARSRRRRVQRLCRRFGVLFLAVQCLEMAAVLGSQLATDLGPSVSLVALVECSLPLFVMLFSGLMAVLLRRAGSAAPIDVINALSQQIDRTPSKLASLLLVVLAIALLGGKGP